MITHTYYTIFRCVRSENTYVLYLYLASTGQTHTCYVLWGKLAKHKKKNTKKNTFWTHPCFESMVWLCVENTYVFFCSCHDHSTKHVRVLLDFHCHFNETHMYFMMLDHFVRKHICVLHVSSVATTWKERSHIVWICQSEIQSFFWQKQVLSAQRFQPLIDCQWQPSLQVEQPLANRWKRPAERQKGCGTPNTEKTTT